MVKNDRPGLRPLSAALSLAGALLAAPLSAEAFLPLPAEAPTSLMEARLGGGEAELLLRGSWELALLSEISLKLPPEGGLMLAEGQPLLFRQTPDLLLSFLLFERWFVEARVSPDASQVRYAAGYRGGPEETLRELRVGNAGIDFPSLPYISFGEGSASSFGLAARAESGGFQGRAMIRYDQAEVVVKTYLGRAELAEAIIPAASFIRGRWFVTPESPAENLVLYVESAEGSLEGPLGSRFRRLEPAEYSYSPATGLIALSRAVETRLAARYGGGGLGADTITVDGLPCALLFDPDVRGADTEVLSRYAAAGGAEEVFVRDRASGRRDEAYFARYDPAGFVEVLRGSPASPSEEGFRQPLRDAMPDLYSRDPEEEAPDFAPLLAKEIVQRRLGRAAEIAIDKDFVLGSVEVLRNGLPDYAFTIDAETGVLSLATPAGLSEEIEVSYLRESAERRTGSLAAGLAGLYSLGETGSAWAALAGRIGLPGTGYAEGGVSTPGSLLLSAGLREEGGKLRGRVALAGSLSTEEASGRYRIEGMEASGAALSSFAPTSGSGWLPGFSVEELRDEALEEAFPRLALELHREGSVQQALRISASSGGDIELAKILEPVPLEKLRTFAFMARRGSTDLSGASLSIRLDEGSGDPALEVLLPGSEIGPDWARYVFRYGEGEAILYRQTEEGGDLVQVTGATSSHEPLAPAPGRLLIELTALPLGAELWLDELLLEDSRGRRALQAEGLLSYQDPDFLIGEAELPLLGGLSLSLDASAALHESSYASGGLSLASSLGALGFVARLRGRASGEGAALRGGHGLDFPSRPFPLKLSDSFDYDPELGSFSREDGLSLRALGLGLELGQRGAWTPPATEAGTGLLLQEWEARLEGGALLSAGLAARQRSRPARAGLEPGYLGAWLSGFAYLLPRAESSAESRSIEASLGLGALSGGQIARASARVSAEAGAADRRRSELLLRLAAPLSLAKGLKIEPYYQRLWREARAGAGEGLLDLALLSARELGEAPLWTGLPLAELGEDAEGFAASSEGLLEAAYLPELGLALSRPYGSLWTDLLLPSSLNLALRRELGRELSGGTVGDALLLEWKSSSAALNLFGSLGSLPLSSAFATDDYLLSFQGRLSLPASGGEPSWSFQSQQLLGFYAGASGQGGRLGIENRLSLESAPSGSKWSESLRLELVLAPERHWLLDLFRLLASKGASASEGRGAAAPEGRGVAGPEGLGAAGPEGLGAAGLRGGEGPASEGRLASAYLASLLAARPRARTLLGLAGRMGGEARDAEGRRLDLSLEESYEARLSLPERLTASAKLLLSQEREGESGLVSLGLSLGLSLTLSF